MPTSLEPFSAPSLLSTERAADFSRPVAVGLRIVVAGDLALCQFCRDWLGHLGHTVVAAQNGEQMIDLARDPRPDAIVIDAVLSDTSGVEAAREICRSGPVPIVLVSAGTDTDLLRRAGGLPVMAWLVLPLQGVALESAVALAVRQGERLRSLEQEVRDLRQTLEDRKVIERGKGIVMKRLHLEEQDAFRRLRMLSSSQSRKLVEVCRQIAAAEESFAQLERLESRVS